MKKMIMPMLLLSVALALANPPAKEPGRADFTGLYQSKRPDGTWQIEVFDPRTGLMGFVIRESPTKGPVPAVTIVKPYDAHLFFEANLNIRHQGLPPRSDQ